MCSPDLVVYGMYSSHTAAVDAVAVLLRSLPRGVTCQQRGRSKLLAALCARRSKLLAACCAWLVLLMLWTFSTWRSESFYSKRCDEL